LHIGDIGNKTHCSPILYISAFNQIKDAYSTHILIFIGVQKKIKKQHLQLFFYLNHIFRNSHIIHLYIQQN